MGHLLGPRKEPTPEIVAALQAITDARLTLLDARNVLDAAVLHGRRIGATWGQLEAARLGLPHPELVTEGQVATTSPSRVIVKRLERDAKAGKARGRR